MSPKWRYYILGYLMALPQALVGLLVFAVFYRAHSWAWRQGVLTCVAPKEAIWGHPDGQTQGWVQVFAEGHQDSAGLRVHENCHVVQAFLLGPIYVLLYVAFHLVRGYPGNPFEKQAYDRQARYLAKPYPAWGA